MTMVTIPRSEYKKLVQTQREILSRFEKLEKIVKESEPEIKLSVLRRWEKISKEMDRGKGLRFKSAKEMKSYLRSL